MRTVASVFLAALLAVLGYGVFWLVSINYTQAQVKGALEEALNARVSYGAAQWVPDPAHVTMRLPAMQMEFADGPVRRLVAGSMDVQSDFFRRDHWEMVLPPRVEVTLANGSTLLLETSGGVLSWMQDGNRLVLKANSVQVLDGAGQTLLAFGNMVLQRGTGAGGVLLEIASKPRWVGGEATVSGKLQLPEAAFGAMVNTFGGGRVPTVAALMQAAAAAMRAGDTVQVDGLSFKVTDTSGTVSGGVLGTVSLTREGTLAGNLTLTADSTQTLLGWINRAGLLAPRNPLETVAANRFLRGVGRQGAVRLANMQTSLTLNGEPVGPLPVLGTVVGRLWPVAR